MKKLFLAFLFVLPLTVYSQLTKVEHFYTLYPQSIDLYNFFKNELGLPVVWEYQSYGEFSSGGVSLGNVVYEFLRVGDEPGPVIHGIAFEPIQTAQNVLPILDSAKITYGEIDPYYFSLNDGTKLLGWSTIALNAILPDSIFSVFICDYANRTYVHNERLVKSNELSDKNGGLIGIENLKEIIIGIEDFKYSQNEISKLPGIIKINENLFSFTNGPDIRVVDSNAGDFFRILIKVKSLDFARKQLQSIDIKTIETDYGFMLEGKIFSGNQIEFTE